MSWVPRLTKGLMTFLEELWLGKASPTSLPGPLYPHYCPEANPSPDLRLKTAQHRNFPSVEAREGNERGPEETAGGKGSSLWLGPGFSWPGEGPALIELIFTVIFWVENPTSSHSFPIPSAS